MYSTSMLARRGLEQKQTERRSMRNTKVYSTKTKHKMLQSELPIKIIWTLKTWFLIVQKRLKRTGKIIITKRTGVEICN